MLHICTVTWDDFVLSVLSLELVLKLFHGYEGTFASLRGCKIFFALTKCIDTHYGRRENEIAKESFTAYVLCPPAENWSPSGGGSSNAVDKEKVKPAHQMPI